MEGIDTTSQCIMFHCQQSQAITPLSSLQNLINFQLKTWNTQKFHWKAGVEINFLLAPILHLLMGCP